ncbi:hypothetical protein EVAR_38951_1 [Eumeta japonica]|uniref:Endonuclease-reverse transcriptase n=1 Tax=Eumeta variegata TaxID=151549 RepID=A0A4C1W8Y5_EUMVA|nr:hypothetical protein EVAR_38951_1 [Eumeta japonica]
MLNVKRSDRVKNHTIRKKTNVIDITSKIRRLKWQWARHMIRGEEKWSKIVTRWYPREGKRKRGRPEKKWDDDIRQVAGVTWNRVGQDRREWKRPFGWRLGEVGGRLCRLANRPTKSYQILENRLRLV